MGENHEEQGEQEEDPDEGYGKTREKVQGVSQTEKAGSAQTCSLHQSPKTAVLAGTLYTLLSVVTETNTQT